MQTVLLVDSQAKVLRKENGKRLGRGKTYKTPASRIKFRCEGQWRKFESSWLFVDVLYVAGREHTVINYAKMSKIIIGPQIVEVFLK